MGDKEIVVVWLHIELVSFRKTLMLIQNKGPSADGETFKHHTGIYPYTECLL